MYFAWPGIVAAFYVYYYLASGSWSYYFSGVWAYERDLHITTPGFYFAPAIPRIVAAPLTLIAFAIASFAWWARAGVGFVSPPGVVNSVRAFAASSAYTISTGGDDPDMPLPLRALFEASTVEALAAFQTVSRMEGIIPALESAHAVAEGGHLFEIHHAGRDLRAVLDLV